MRCLAEIPISAIAVDRWPMGPRTLALVRHLEKGNTIPPIHIQKVDNGYRVLDGRHRILAFKLLGRKTITAKYGIQV